MTARDPLVCTLAKLNAPGLLGFLVQCSVCPQQALLDTQPDGEWTCPRCAEVAETRLLLPNLCGGFGGGIEADEDDQPLGEKPPVGRDELLGRGPW
jgi:hypothetical protein